jgi:hypothetical protein
MIYLKWVMTNSASALLRKYLKGLNPALSTTQAVAFCDQYQDQQVMNLITLSY